MWERQRCCHPSESMRECTLYLFPLSTKGLIEDSCRFHSATKRRKSAAGEGERESMKEDRKERAGGPNVATDGVDISEVPNALLDKQAQKSLHDGFH